AQAPSPAALVFIHGGYWRSLDRRRFSFLARSFNDLGASCFMPSYGLAPQTPMEDIVAQAAASVRWVHENAARYGADPGRLVVVGHSAGAHLLATILAGRAPGLDAMPEDWIRGALAISGVYDLRPLLLVPFLNADLQLTAEQAEALSPALSRPAGRTPLWTSVGGIEPGEFHRQTRLLEQQWPEVWTGAIEMPASNHLSILDELAVRGSPLNEALANMVDGTR
ncbi:MAG: alpha/beta hydrolase, partial [Burkholderiaceae bacterium]